ncbi:hypothetical protein ADU86_03870 [Clostridium botulinum]|uniref:helix-turn-helix domain-containing protein n=1 Tax=Clostridium botulinum TaxID=1491 RepID=UPI0006A511E4|nr:helix-turn-helix transcriptional regulator [Clostridium botulinum]KOC47744.1 hypothetical protein ADU86_03870 [Clostridium botulinum]
MQLTLKDLRNNIEGIYSITTDKVANKLGISREHYTRLEKGVYKLDTLKIEKLSILFKVNEVTIINAWENSRKEGGLLYVRNSKN